MRALMVSRFLVLLSVAVVLATWVLAGQAAQAVPADWTTGEKSTGQALADGTVLQYGLPDDLVSPRPVAGLPDVTMTTLASGKGHTCGVTTDGDVYCWGPDLYGQIGPEQPAQPGYAVKVTGIPPAADVAAGEHFACVAAENGTVWCWGQNEHAQLGVSPTDPQEQPVQVQGIAEPVVSVDSDFWHTCALDESGAVYCWGYNESGQLGSGEASPWELPLRAQHLSAGALAVTVGSGHSCVLTAERTVRCWGDAESSTGIAGLADLLQPTRIDALGSHVRRIASASGHNCALRLGDLVCWGNNSSGQLGGGKNNDDPVQEVKGGPENVAGFDVHYGRSCATSDDGRMWCWGYRASERERTYTPTRVNGFFPGWVAQPDALLKTPDGWIGRDIYTEFANSQTVRRSMQIGERKHVTLRVVNDGDARDFITLDAERLVDGFRFQALVDGKDRRTELKNGDLVVGARTG